MGWAERNPHLPLVALDSKWQFQDIVMFIKVCYLDVGEQKMSHFSAHAFVLG